MPKEQWRPVVGYEDCYKVSNRGEVRSIPRTYFNPGSQRWCKLSGMTLLDSPTGKPALNGTRYKVVNLKGKTKYVHQIVMEAFVGPSNGLDVNHKDGNKDNNALENLEYVTRKSNLQHASHNRLLSNLRPVVMIEDDNHILWYFPSISKAEKITGAKGANITKVCQKKRVKAGGYRWMYSDEACSRAEELGLW